MTSIHNNENTNLNNFARPFEKKTSPPLHSRICFLMFYFVIVCYFLFSDQIDVYALQEMFLLKLEDNQTLLPALFVTSKMFWMLIPVNNQFKEV